MDAELTRAALAVLRPIYGDVGIIAEMPMPSDDGLIVARLVLITDAGPRTVILTSPRDDSEAWVRLRAATDALGVCDDPPLMVLADPG